MLPVPCLATISRRGTCAPMTDTTRKSVLSVSSRCASPAAQALGARRAAHMGEAVASPVGPATNSKRSEINLTTPCLRCMIRPGEEGKPNPRSRSSVGTVRQLHAPGSCATGGCISAVLRRIRSTERLRAQNQARPSRNSNRRILGTA